MKRSLLPSEHQIQASYFDWVKRMIPKDPRFEAIFAIPNGSKRHLSIAVKLKREGVKSGVWDIFVMVPSKKFNAHGLWIETKKPKGKLIETQIEFQKLCQKYKYANRVGHSFEQLKLITETYFEYE